MASRSAGILVFRTSPVLQFFLVHPGGPFWRNKEDGAWTIPKGEFSESEDPLSAAKREFHEETGHPAPEGEYTPLKPITQKGGKLVLAFLVNGNLDETRISSNIFELQWPPNSGRIQKFPEVDRAAWFTADVATLKILESQQKIILEALEVIAAS